MHFSYFDLLSFTIMLFCISLNTLFANIFSRFRWSVQKPGQNRDLDFLWMLSIVVLSSFFHYICLNDEIFNSLLPFYSKILCVCKIQFIIEQITIPSELVSRFCSHLVKIGQHEKLNTNFMTSFLFFFFLSRFFPVHYKCYKILVTGD